MSSGGAYPWMDAVVIPSWFLAVTLKYHPMLLSGTMFVMIVFAAQDWTTTTPELNPEFVERSTW